jgi:hypothetical protein
MSLDSTTSWDCETGRKYWNEWNRRHRRDTISRERHEALVKAIRGFSHLGMWH